MGTSSAEGRAGVREGVSEGVRIGSKISMTAKRSERGSTAMEGPKDNRSGGSVPKMTLRKVDISTDVNAASPGFIVPVSLVFLRVADKDVFGCFKIKFGATFNRHVYKN